MSLPTSRSDTQSCASCVASTDPLPEHVHVRSAAVLLHSWATAHTHLARARARALAHNTATVTTHPSSSLSSESSNSRSGPSPCSTSLSWSLSLPSSAGTGATFAALVALPAFFPLAASREKKKRRGKTMTRRRGLSGKWHVGEGACMGRRHARVMRCVWALKWHRGHAYQLWWELAPRTNIGCERGAWVAATAPMTRVGKVVHTPSSATAHLALRQARHCALCAYHCGRANECQGAVVLAQAPAPAQPWHHVFRDGGHGTPQS